MPLKEMKAQKEKKEKSAPNSHTNLSPVQSHLYRRNVTICVCGNSVERKDEERGKRRHDELAGN
jgi:intracellular sulfur oxidation DsrE/DsrF family protein